MAYNANWLQHHHSDPAPVLLVRRKVLVETTPNERGSPIEQIVVKLAIASAEFLLLEKQGIIQEGECVEDIKVELQP